MEEMEKDERVTRLKDLIEEQNWTEALPLAESLSAEGNDEGEVLLGLLYYDGHGVTQNAAKAKELFEKSWAQGNARGQIVKSSATFLQQILLESSNPFLF